MRKLLFSCLLFVSAASADFDTKRWHVRIPVPVAPGRAVSQFTITPEVFRNSSAQLNDLRIIRNEDDEVAYTIRKLQGDVEQNEQSVRLLNKAFTKAIGVQAILDLEGHQEHNRLRIATSEHNFKQKVIVETSDDEKHWSLVLTDGVIFDIFRPEAKVFNTTVKYPTSTRRYVRVTIPGWSNPASLESAWLANYKESATIRDNIATLSPMITQNKIEQTTDFLFDLGYPGQPCDRIILQLGPGLFSRMASISASDDLKLWSYKAGAYIFRTDHEETLGVEFPESWTRYIKLTVYNADSNPLNVTTATASAIRRELRFPSTEAGTYWLYLNNPDARTSVYDFTRVDDPDTTAAPVKLGITEPNPSFKPPPTPYSERKPWILNLILGIAVSVMGIITYRFARKAKLGLGPS